jgi:phosphoserine phosphatase RsbU/P
MRDNFPTGLLQIERLAFGTDAASQLVPCRVRSAAALDYAGKSQPAGNGGNDFFDFIPVQPHGLIAVIGDVSGRSAEAAALVVPGLRGFLRTGLPVDPGNIRRVVRDLNRTLCDTAPDSFYATLFCAWIDPERRELRYVNAGHEPALLVRSGGERICRLESTGTVLGLTTRAAFGMQTIALEPGDMLATFTDGVVEAADSAGRAFGESGVLQVLCDHPGARSSELVGRLVDAVREFADRARPADDRTVALIRFNGAVSTAQLQDEIEEAAFEAA